MEIGKLPMYVQIGTEMVLLGLSTIEKIRAFAAQNGADEAQLARLDQLYEERLARARKAARPPV